MPIHRNASLLPIVIVLALLLSSCNYPGLQPSEELLATAAAATVSALLTESATEAPASAVAPSINNTRAKKPSPEILINRFLLTPTLDWVCAQT